MPRTTDTPTAILEAAVLEFSEHGFSGTRMESIARRAGVNKALVFYYFNSKAELFDAVLERYYETHREALQGAFQAEGPFRERFRFEALYKRKLY